MSIIATRNTGSDGHAKWGSLLVFTAFVLAVAIIGSLAATSASDTYEELEKPPFAPPTWVYSPVWTVLYIALAISGWRAFLAGADAAELTLYGFGLVLNALWTPLFFVLDEFELALLDLVLLDIVVAVTMVLFWQRSKLAGALQAPYLAWILFATALNGAIVALN